MIAVIVAVIVIVVGGDALLAHSNPMIPRYGHVTILGTLNTSILPDDPMLTLSAYGKRRKHSACWTSGGARGEAFAMVR